MRQLELAFRQPLHPLLNQAGQRWRPQQAEHRRQRDERLGDNAVDSGNALVKKRPAGQIGARRMRSRRTSPATGLLDKTIRGPGTAFLG